MPNAGCKLPESQAMPTKAAARMADAEITHTDFLNPMEVKPKCVALRFGKILVAITHIRAAIEKRCCGVPLDHKATSSNRTRIPICNQFSHIEADWLR